MLNGRLKEALLYVLLRKVYPRYPVLVRNDSATARVLKSYVSEMFQIYLVCENVNPPRPSRIQEDAHTLFYAGVYDLQGLSVETLRKYIRVLWQEEEISKHLQFTEFPVWELEQKTIEPESKL